MNSTTSIADATSTSPVPSTDPQSSIWKRDTDTGVRGPSSRLTDIGFHMSAEWSEEKGVHFWGNLERESEEYSLAEVRKIHRAMGRLLDKVDADPKPATVQAAK